MKTTLFVLCLLFTTTAFAQNYGSSLNSQVQTPQFQSHEAHASYAAMAQERNNLPTSNFTSAQGERPASDFPQAEPVSLGAAAREIRKQHALAKKSRVVWINQ